MIVKQKLRKPSPVPRAPTIILTANTAWYLVNFRLNLATRLREEGYRVLLVAPVDKQADFLKSQGFEFRDWQVSRAGIGPVSALLSCWKLFRVYRAEKPVAVHHFTLKCILFGTLAAGLAGAPRIFNSITGLGHLFIDRSLGVRATRWPVLIALRVLFRVYAPQLIFQNSADRAAFAELGLISPLASAEIATSGFDPSHYRRAAGSIPSPRPIVLFAGRVIAEKGVREFVEAACILRGRGSNARFVVAGACDDANPSALPAALLADWRKEGVVELVGHVADLRPLMETASIFALPSYREGGSRVILEAAAMELPVVTTAVPGCENLVDHGSTGLIVPVRDSSKLAEAIASLLADPARAARMGKAGRQKAVQEFSSEVVIGSTMALYSSRGISLPASRLDR